MAGADLMAWLAACACPEVCAGAAACRAEATDEATICCSSWTCAAEKLLDALACDRLDFGMTPGGRREEPALHVR